jgi:hypothetical protein
MGVGLFSGRVGKGGNWGCWFVVRVCGGWINKHSGIGVLGMGKKKCNNLIIMGEGRGIVIIIRRWDVKRLHIHIIILNCTHRIHINIHIGYSHSFMLIMLISVHIPHIGVLFHVELVFRLSLHLQVFLQVFFRNTKRMDKKLR